MLQLTERARENRLLEALSGDELHRLADDCEYATHAAGTALIEPHRHVQSVFFPTSSVIALVHAMDDGSTSTVGMVGNEGVVGLTTFLDDDRSPEGAVVRMTGGTISMPATALRYHLARAARFQQLLLGYTQRLIVQISRTAACRRRHRIEQQVAGWLLMTYERQHARDLMLTQDDLAGVLGVRRESVSQAARSLWKVGCIVYRRGRIHILDRQALEKKSCECWTNGSRPA